jgi:hypothetical protein
LHEKWRCLGIERMREPTLAEGAVVQVKLVEKQWKVVEKVEGSMLLEGVEQKRLYCSRRVDRT